MSPSDPPREPRRWYDRLVARLLRRFCPWVDARGFASLAAALRHIADRRVNLLVSRPLADGGERLTVPPNVTLEFLQGGALEISALPPARGTLPTERGDTGAGLPLPTVKLDGCELIAGPDPIFQGTGQVGGKISNRCVFPQWWGAVGDDSTDCTAAINRAVKLASDNGIPVQLPPGRYLTSGWIQAAPIAPPAFDPPDWLTLDLRGVASCNPRVGRVTRHDASYGTVVSCTGPIGSDQRRIGIALVGTRDARISNLTLIGPGKDVPGSIGILLHKGNVGLRVEDVTIRGFETAVQFGADPEQTIPGLFPYQSHNDDQTAFRDVRVDDCKAGIRIWGQNSFMLRFSDCSWYDGVDRLLISELVGGASSKSDVLIDGGFAGCPEGLAFLEAGNGGVLRIDKLFYEPPVGAEPLIVATQGGVERTTKVEPYEQQDYAVHLDSCMLGLGDRESTPLFRMTGAGTLTLTRCRISHGRPVLELSTYSGYFAARLADNEWENRPIVQQWNGDPLKGVIEDNERPRR